MILSQYEGNRCDEEFLHQQQTTHTERYHIFYDEQYLHIILFFCKTDDQVLGFLEVGVGW